VLNIQTTSASALAGEMNFSPEFLPISPHDLLKIKSRNMSYK
jgi:hypothetical protein